MPPPLIDPDTLQLAFATTEQILIGVAETTLGDRTPCAEWDVRELMEHIVSAADFFGDVGELGASPEDRKWPEYGYVDMVPSFQEHSRRVTAVFAGEDAMDRPMLLPSGQTTGATCIQVVVGEMFTHGWDLARATGQEPPPDELAEALWRSEWPGLCELVRHDDNHPFTDEVAVDSGAPTVDLLLGFIGRDPRWAPDHH